MEFLWNSLWHLLLNILVAINSVVGSPGVSIIIFTLFIRLLTVPLTMKSLRSSRNMQAIQPKIKEIQKQHGKDRQKQQEEMMKLYQQYGINPAAGCFPILIQLPIFFGLFSALQFTLGGNTGTEAQIAEHARQLREILWNDSWVSAANFSVPFGWVQNLAAPDPIWAWPILSGVFQFIQSRMAMPYREPGTQLDSQTKMMNGLMQFMPIYIVFISINFPAGTVIYWAFSSLFGAVQQYFITGFGTLPNIPGLGFLPVKPLAVPDISTLKPAEKKKQGAFGWMMSRALEAQEQQRGTGETSAGTPTTPIAAPTAEATGASTVRIGNAKDGKGSKVGKQRLAAETTAGDTGDVGNYTGNGVPPAPVTLPRKKRNKR